MAAVSLKEACGNFSPKAKWDDFREFPSLIRYDKGTLQTFQTLRNKRVQGNTAVGLATFCFLDFVSQRGVTARYSHIQIEKIVLIHRNELFQELWNRIIRLIKVSKTREECIKDIGELLLARVEPLEVAQAYTKELQESIESGYSWLSNDSRFRKIKAIADRADMIFLGMYFGDDSRRNFPQLQKILAKSNCTIDVCYLGDCQEINQFEAEQLYESGPEDGGSELVAKRECFENDKAAMTSDNTYVIYTQYDKSFIAKAHP